MNKIFAFIFILSVVFFTSCKDTEEQVSVQYDVQIENSEASAALVDEVFDISVSFANWTEESEIFIGSLNNKKMYESRIQHLPIYKFDTASDLERFKSRIGDQLVFDSGYDEIPSFNEATSMYSDDFFEENTLMLVYVPANSGSFRYGVNSVYKYGESLCIHIEQTNSPEEVTNDMAGWFVTLCIPDSIVEACTEFDADLNNIQ